MQLLTKNTIHVKWTRCMPYSDTLSLQLTLTRTTSLTPRSRPWAEEEGLDLVVRAPPYHGTTVSRNDVNSEIQ